MIVARLIKNNNFWRVIKYFHCFFWLFPVHFVVGGQKVGCLGKIVTFYLDFLLEEKAVESLPKAERMIGEIPPFLVEVVVVHSLEQKEFPYLFEGSVGVHFPVQAVVSDLFEGSVGVRFPV